MPLVDRVAPLKIPVIFACNFPSLFPDRRLYLMHLSSDGDSDWMDPEGGAKAIENLAAAGNTQSRLYTVKHAGHHRKLTFVISSHPVLLS